MERDKISEHILSQWDKCLHQFSDNLIPSDLYIEKGTEAVKKVIRALQQNSKNFSICRESITGSIGKKTSIMDSDFDCVLFLNDQLPPFTDVLDNFEDILTLASTPKVENLRSTRFSVQFVVEGGFNVDLLPAANLLDPKTQLAHPELAKAQAAEAMKIIRQDPKKDSYVYSSSICEAQLYFMREQDGFAHMIVRLAKYWYKSLYFGDCYVSGAKMLIELVAVAAAQKESKFEKKSPLRAFRRFLEMIEKFKSLRIVFEASNVLSDKDVNDLKNGRKRLAVNPSDYILGKQNFVLDPINPFNDLAGNWKIETIEMIQKFAETTSSRIRELFEISFTAGPPPGLPYPSIFEHQPRILPRAESVILPPRIACGANLDNDSDSFCPSLIIRNEDRFKPRHMRDFLTGFQTYLQLGVYSLAANPEMTTTGIQTAITGLIDVQIYGQPKPTTWVPGSRSHESYECTLIVPYQDQNQTRYSVKVSLEW